MCDLSNADALCPLTLFKVTDVTIMKFNVLVTSNCQVASIVL